MDIPTKNSPGQSFEARIASSLFNFASELLIIVNSTGRISLISKSVSAILGKDSDLLRGTNFTDLLQKADKNVILHQLSDGMPSQKVDLTMLHKNGSERHFKGKIIKLTEEFTENLFGNSVSLILLKNITPDRKLLFKLRGAEEELEDLKSALPVALIKTNSSFDVIESNQAFSELISTQLTEDEDAATDTKVNLKDVLLTNSYRQLQRADEGRLKADGWVGINNIRLHTRKDKVYCIHAWMQQGDTLMFISEQSTDKQLHNAQLEFMRIVSHQLKTPLTIMNWYTKLLQEEKRLTKKQKGYLREIEGATGRLAGSVSKITKILQVHLGQYRSKIKPTSLEQFFRKSTESIISKFEDVDVNLKINTSGLHIKSAMLDTKLYSEVIDQVVTNAILYNPDKQQQLYCDLKSNLHRITVTIRDQGIGIPTDFHEEALKQFTRAENAKKLIAGADGSGLYLAKLLLSSIGADIWIETNEDNGTDVFFTVPLVNSTSDELA
ncbi:MAG: ATP-binding protein [Candidatus Dojkabacteria bacterium]